MKSFTAHIIRPPGVGTWHYVELPFDTVAEFGSKGQIKVKGTLGGVPFRSTLLPQGGAGHYLVVGKELRDAAGVGVGDLVAVSVLLDDAPREIELETALAEALASNATAKAAFEALSYSRRKLINQQIATAKKEETRAKRIEQTLLELVQG